MNKILLQLWEDKLENLSDGCSLHSDISSRNSFIINDNRHVGDVITVFIDDDIYDQLIKDGYMRLMEHQMNNLINSSRIIINPLDV